jgi:hypothetical protein
MALGPYPAREGQSLRSKLAFFKRNLARETQIKTDYCPHTKTITNPLSRGLKLVVYVYILGTIIYSNFMSNMRTVHICFVRLEKSLKNGKNIYTKLFVEKNFYA